MSSCVLLTVADPQIGLGHLYRSDALAAALAHYGADVTLVVDCIEEAHWLAQRAPENPWRIAPWKHDREQLLAAVANSEWVIIDAYGVDTSVKQTISRSTPKPIYFDDDGSTVPQRGTLINGSPGAHLLNYPHHSGLTLLVGPRYQVLRKPFWEPTRRIIRREVESVGVMLGGTDHRRLIDSILPLVCEAVPANTRVYAIGNYAGLYLQRGVEATGLLTAKELKELFGRLDLLITTAGQTVAEAVSCELSTVMIQTAENQNYNVQGWVAESCSALAGWYRSEGLSNQLEKRILEETDYRQRIRRRRAMRVFDLQASALRVAHRILHGTEGIASLPPLAF